MADDFSVPSHKVSSDGSRNRFSVNLEFTLETKAHYIWRASFSTQDASHFLGSFKFRDFKISLVTGVDLAG